MGGDTRGYQEENFRKMIREWFRMEKSIAYECCHMV